MLLSNLMIIQSQLSHLGVLPRNFPYKESEVVELPSDRGIEVRMVSHSPGKRYVYHFGIDGMLKRIFLEEKTEMGILHQKDVDLEEYGINSVAFFKAAEMDFLVPL